MLLSYNELVQLVWQGVISAPFENINSASIDLTLDSVIMLEEHPKYNKVVRLAQKESIEMRQYEMGPNGYHLKPGEFILASSVEIFNLPSNISAEYKLKSTMARNGLEHLNAGWCDAGWNGSKLTLELKNMTQRHEIIIEPGMKCGQVVFFRHTEVPKDKSYAERGQYNGQDKVTSAGVLR